VATYTQQPQSGEFVPMPADQGRENLPATPFVFTAYALVWIILVVYVLSLWRRMNRVEREVADLSARAGGRTP
jgi:CcmD family protein